MIDAHLHVVPPNLPGVGALNPRLNDAPSSVAAWLAAEMRAAGISHALGMGAWATTDDDPLGTATTLAIADRVPGLFAIGICDPTRGDPEHLRRAEAALATGRIKALKIYLGYLHFEPGHAAYRPYYELAERANVPVVFHTGDTYSMYAKLKYAHPLGVDEVAVDHPRVRFVLAHCGNPWLTDAAEVIFKNVNVWADLSGLVTGTAWQTPDEEGAAALADLRDGVRRAVRYSERPNRFVFGSDWPLASLPAYRELIAGWFPAARHEQLFRDTARMLFRL